MGNLNEVGEIAKKSKRRQHYSWHVIQMNKVSYRRNYRKVIIVLLALGWVALYGPNLASALLLNIGTLKMDRAMMTEGQVLTPTVNLEDTIGILEQARNLQRNQASVYEALVKAYALEGDRSELADVLSHYVSVAPDTRPGMLWLILRARLAAESGFEAESSTLREEIAAQAGQAHYRIYTSDYEGEAKWLANEAGQYARTGQYSKAESIFKLVNATAPWSSIGFYGLGDVYRVQKRWDEAIASFRSGAAVDPAPSKAFIGIGRVYLNEDDAVNADALMMVGQQALNYGAWEWGHFMVGRAWEWKKEWTRAVVHYQAVIDNHRNNDPGIVEPVWFSYFYIGNTFEVRKDFDSAVSYYRGAADVSHEYGSDARALGYVANVYRLQGKHAEAIVELEHALNLLIGWAGQDALKLDLLKALGDSCWVIGRYECATKIYQEELKLQPNDRFAQARLDSLLGSGR